MSLGDLMQYLQLFFLIYVILIGAFSVFVTVYDKRISMRRKGRNKKNRVKEDTFFVLALIGGSLPMYITMRIIRHKTRKTTFMIGLPCIFAIQVAVILVWYFRII